MIKGFTEIAKDLSFLFALICHSIFIFVQLYVIVISPNLRLVVGL